MKSLLTIATGMTFFAASGVYACPYMDAKQKTTELNHQDQTQQSLVEKDVEKIDPKILAKLLLENQEKQIN